MKHRAATTTEQKKTIVEEAARNTSHARANKSRIVAVARNVKDVAHTYDLRKSLSLPFLTSYSVVGRHVHFNFTQRRFLPRFCRITCSSVLSRNGWHFWNQRSFFPL